jgi:FtsP/CotA-like multicopper oxidase with cupredoxin domain
MARNSRFRMFARLFEVTRPLSISLRRDTVTVPRPAKGGSTVIRTRFLDYTGVFMMHCHMMNHEELGMMQAIEVYKD